MIQTVLVSALFPGCAVYRFRASNESCSLPEEARKQNCDPRTFAVDARINLNNVG